MTTKRTFIISVVIISVILISIILLFLEKEPLKKDKIKDEKTPVYETQKGKWEILGPGGGGTLESILIDPVNNDIIYAIINCGGVRKSINGGKRWLILNNGLKYHEYGTLAA